MASRSLSKEPAPPPLPTDAEIAILAVLWRQGASTVREVHEALGKDSGYTTTLKLMQLMFEKGLVARNERYRSHSATPAATTNCGNHCTTRPRNSAIARISVTFPSPVSARALASSKRARK